MDRKPAYLAIDIETYSSVSLPDCGVKPYTEAPDFAVLMVAYKLDDQPTKIIDLAGGRAEPHPNLLTSTCDVHADILGGSMPEFTRLLFNTEVIKTAYNAPFERICLAQYFGQPMPPEQWQCTMVLAATLGLPGSLAAVGEALGLDKQKLAEGKALMKYFSSPCAATKANGGRTRNLPEDAPDKWADYLRYCIRDVDVETEIRTRLRLFLPPVEEHEAWQLDQHINDRGVGVDSVLVQQAIALNNANSSLLLTEARELTGLDNPNSGPQLKAWLAGQGLEVDSLTKDTVPELVAQTENAAVHRVLQIRQELAKTSVAKFEAMERGLCADGRVRNLLQFYGAGRTGRWAGRHLQIQNLPQNKLLDLALARELVRGGEFELLKLLFGSPSFVLSQLIRTALIPSPSRQFIVADFSAIEARVLAWLAGEEWVLEVFRGDGLIYEATASMMFHVPKDDIKKGGARADLRSKGKVATLACGYQGGAAALIQMGALSSGIPEEELPGIVKSWRAANRRIVKYWYDVEAAAIGAVEGHTATLAHGVKFSCERDYLFITLPSGRNLAYYKPELRHDAKFDKMGLTYMGVDQRAGKVYARQKTYGGKLAENITQAVARDCLRDSMLALDAAGHEIVMHVHDEVVIDAPAGASLPEVLALMGRPLPWAPGLPLRADGFRCDFYMKD